MSVCGWIIPHLTCDLHLLHSSAAERAEVIKSLYGHVRKLIRHSEAGDVVEVAYNDYANATQRKALIQEFYGTDFALFKDTSPEGVTNPAHPLGTLGEVLENNSARRKGILTHMKDSLLPLLDK